MYTNVNIWQIIPNLKGVITIISEALLFDQNFYTEFSDKNWQFSFDLRHFHRSYEIYYLLENEILYYINNKVYHVMPGSVIIVPPNTIHTTRSLNQLNRKRILINLPLRYIESFLEDDPNILKNLHKPPIHLTGTKKEKIESLFFSILEEFNSNSPRKILIKSLLGQLLIELGEVSKENFKSDMASCDDAATRRMLDIVDYINLNYHKKITLESLSKMFFLNPTYISRSFKEKFNISFSDYLRTVRVKEACELLENSSLKLDKIAETTGFNDNSDLCRTFKAIMRITPSKYKSNRINNSNT